MHFASFRKRAELRGVESRKKVLEQVAELVESGYPEIVLANRGTHRRLRTRFASSDASAYTIDRRYLGEPRRAASAPFVHRTEYVDGRYLGPDGERAEICTPSSYPISKRL